MAEKTWSEFYPQVKPYVGGCPNPVIDRELRNTAIDFLRNTSAWRYDQHAAIDLVDDTGQYTLTPPAKALIERVTEAFVKDEASATPRPIRPKTIDELRALFSNWRTEKGSPAYYSHETNNLTLYVVPKPDLKATVTGGLTPWLTLTPNQVATGIEDYLFDRYLQTLAHGAVSRILAIPDRRWTDRGKAADEKFEYEKGRLQAQVELFTSFTTGDMRVHPRYPLA